MPDPRPQIARQLVNTPYEKDLEIDPSGRIFLKDQLVEETEQLETVTRDGRTFQIAQRTPVGVIVPTRGGWYAEGPAGRYLLTEDGTRVVAEYVSGPEGTLASYDERQTWQPCTLDFSELSIPSLEPSTEESEPDYSLCISN